MPHHSHHMTRNDWIRFAVVLAIAIGAVVLIVYPPRAFRDIVPLGLDLQGGVRLVLEAEGVGEMSDELQTETIERVQEILRNRIDQYGLANAELRRFGGDRILVSLPGATDTQEARSLIGQTALLEFRRVIDAGTSPLDDLVPTSSNQVFLRDREGLPYLVENEVLLTGAGLANATVGTRQSLTAAGMFQILLEFSREGAEQFARVMNRMDVGERLAIILDNTIYSAPVVSESIKEAAAQGWRSVKDTTTISGSFTQDEARILSIALRAGALPVAITTIEEDIVGPTLGSDSIRRGMMTIAIGFILILVYMMIFYRGLGVVANLALILNMLIIFGALILFHAVLTLPGIAGIILTIGMTVDANVIIFERVKEERRTGKSPLASVRAGFEKSLSTLFDANITTLFMAVILLLLGTGPIRGFAITLGIGVAGSLFCALVASRLLLEKAGFANFIPARVVREE